MLGVKYMADVPKESGVLAYARKAFLEESGGALICKYLDSDPLFTSDGYRDYADDLLIRMTNPYLKDAIERVTRDTERKLGWGDRLIGTMRLALDQGIQPHRYALGAAAALVTLDSEVLKDPSRVDAILGNIWAGILIEEEERREIYRLVKAAMFLLRNWKDKRFPALEQF